VRVSCAEEWSTDVPPVLRDLYAWENASQKHEEMRQDLRMNCPEFEGDGFVGEDAEVTEEFAGEDENTVAVGDATAIHVPAAV
jgi:hypothetical protein